MTSLKQYLTQFAGTSFFYGNAAHAFYDVMVWLQQNRPKKKPNIVMPVYIPAKLYRFVLAAGYEPKFYDVSTDLDVNLKEISGLIDDQTQAVFAVHFFGVPIDMRPLKALTEQAGIVLIEDCAHALNGSYKGTPFGTTGDVTLFSTRKMMQFHCGGILVLNSQPWEFSPSKEKRVRSLFVAYHLLGSRVKFRVNNALNGHHPFRKLELPGTGYLDFSETHFVDVKRMDRFSEWYCQRLDVDKLVKKRRDNVLFLLNELQDLSFIQPLGLDRYATQDQAGRYSLNEGFSPFSLPVLIPREHRDRVQQAICDAGVVCHIGWPEAPFGMKGFLGAERLRHGLLELPVHKFMDTHHLRSIVNCVNSLPKVVRLHRGLQLVY